MVVLVVPGGWKREVRERALQSAVGNNFSKEDFSGAMIEPNPHRHSLASRPGNPGSGTRRITHLCGTLISVPNEHRTRGTIMYMYDHSCLHITIRTKRACNIAATKQAAISPSSLAGVLIKNRTW